MFADCSQSGQHTMTPGRDTQTRQHSHPQEAYNPIKEETTAGTRANKQMLPILRGQAIGVRMVRIWVSREETEEAQTRLEAALSRAHAGDWERGDNCPVGFQSQVQQLMGALQRAAQPSKQDGLATARRVVPRRMELLPGNVQEAWTVTWA